MSFNLNKLVQPECGGSNPLVSAAQHISMNNPALGSASRLHRPQAPVNFAREFMQQHKPHTALSAEMSSQVNQSNHFISRRHLANQANLIYTNTQLTSGGGGVLAKDFLIEHELSEGLERINMAGSGNQMLAPGTSRSSFVPSMMGYGPMMHAHNQMIERMHHNQDNKSSISGGDQLETKYRNDMITQSSSYQQDSSGKLDDVAFWQSLSQQYIGPSTYDAMAKVKTEKKSPTNVGEEILADSQQEEDQMAIDSDVPLMLSDEREPPMEYTFDDRNPIKDQFEDPFAEGIKRLELGDIPSAVLLFEAAVQLKPEDAVAWRYLGTTQALNENDHSAIRALRNCLKFDQDDQQARLAIAVSLANEYERKEACKHLLEWLMRHEKYKIIGVTLEEFNQFSPESFNLWSDSKTSPYYYVRDKFVEAARMSPSDPDPEVQNSLGVLFNILGEYDKAVDCFTAALSVRSEDSVLWNRLGATLANGNKSDEAVIAYKKALEISPGFLRTRYNLAISLVHLNIYDEAAKQLVKILNMQAAGKGSKDQIRVRSVTSSTIWNTLRTVATLQNKPEWYPLIEGRDLARLNGELFKQDSGSSGGSSN